MFRYLYTVLFALLLGHSSFLAAQGPGSVVTPGLSPEISVKIEQGKQLILKAEFETAKTILRQLVNQNPKLGVASFYLGLATVGNERKKEIIDEASEHFLNAARLGYHLPFGTWDKYPVNENSYAEANWKYANKYINDKDPQNYDVAINLLENMVSVNHRQHNASDRLGELFIKTGQNRKALDLFQRLLEANPDQSESIYKLGLGFLDIYNPQIANTILADLSGESQENMTSLMKLLMARAFFALGENRIASVYYSQCLADLNEIAAREIYRDVIDITTDKEREEYGQTRTIEEKQAFFRKFWKSRDPSPTTEYNERLIEHYRRLNYAKQNYHVNQTKGYDDRGHIYIKHGEPDQKTQLVGNFGLRDNESWMYRRKPNNFIFHFVRKTSNYFIVPRLTDAIIGSPLTSAFMNVTQPVQDESGGVNEQDVTLEASEFTKIFRELLLNRAEIDPFYFTLGSHLADFGDPEYLQRELETNYQMEEARLIEPALTTAEVTETYKPDLGVDPLNYYYYTSDFMAVNANSNVNIYYGLPVGELDFKRDILGVRINYEATFAVFDQNWNEVKRVYNQRSFQFKQEPSNLDKGLLLVDRQILNLPPGDYHYSVSVKDMGSDHLGIYNGDFSVTPYEHNKFNVSQVVLASNISKIEEGQTPGKFARGNLNVMPLPSRTFRRDQAVFIYYEVYFLDKDSEGKKRYNIDFAIEAEKLDQNLASKVFSSFGRLVSSKEEKGKITLTFDKEQEDPERIVQVEYISIDITDSPSGRYGLNITVTDAATGEKVNRKATFMIVDSGK